MNFLINIEELPAREQTDRGRGRHGKLQTGSGSGGREPQCGARHGDRFCKRDGQALK
jgi:hypothetical protein